MTDLMGAEKLLGECIEYEFYVSDAVDMIVFVDIAVVCGAIVEAGVFG